MPAVCCLAACIYNCHYHQPYKREVSSGKPSWRCFEFEFVGLYGLWFVLWYGLPDEVYRLKAVRAWGTVGDPLNR